MLEDITRKNIHNYLKGCIHEARSFAQPDIHLLEVEGKRFVLKDYYNRPLITRLLWAKPAIRREFRALERLRAIFGIPAIHRQLDGYGFIMEFLEAERLPKREEKPEIPPEFFEELEALLKRLHSEGITHGDIRRKNVLIGTGKENCGKPFLIDFATSLYHPHSRGFIRK